MAYLLAKSYVPDAAQRAVKEGSVCKSGETLRLYPEANSERETKRLDSVRQLEIERQENIS